MSSVRKFKNKLVVAGELDVERLDNQEDILAPTYKSSVTTTKYIMPPNSRHQDLDMVTLLELASNPEL